MSMLMYIYTIAGCRRHPVEEEAGGGSGNGLCGSGREGFGGTSVGEKEGLGRRYWQTLETTADAEGLRSGIDLFRGGRSR